jgi:GDP-L-fucose synthase
MKVLVTGGSGQVGNELQKFIPTADYISSKDVNLLNNSAVEVFMKKNRYDVVVHLAAKVGGIFDNINKPSDYIEENLIINSNILRWSRLSNVTRFIGVLSTCVYPDVCDTYPMSESQLHNGPPTPTNFSYGYAKRCMAVQIDAMNKQYGTEYQYLTPCNLYGDFDKFNHASHFVADLIRKIHESKVRDEKFIQLYGTGTPLRQFMNAEDFAKIIYKTLDNNITESFNVASDKNLSIHEIATIALDSLGCGDFKIMYDSSQPDGQYRKDVCTKKFKKLFKDYKFIDLKTGIKKCYEKNFIGK